MAQKAAHRSDRSQKAENQSTRQEYFNGSGPPGQRVSITEPFKEQGAGCGEPQEQQREAGPPWWEHGIQALHPEKAAPIDDRGIPYWQVARATPFGRSQPRRGRVIATEESEILG